MLDVWSIFVQHPEDGIIIHIKLLFWHISRLQVAQKFMKVGSIIIGIDLDKIKPIKGVVTFQQDIT